MMRRFLGTCVLLTVAGSPALEAQCPDGSPPPCRSLVRADTNAFVVIPFAVSGPAAVQYLGGSMVDLLQMALDGVGRMRIEYAPTNLRRLSQLSGSRDARAAASTALEMGAARVITGSVVVIGSDVRIRAEVFDALRNRTQFVVEGRATLDNLTVVVDSLASQILARRLVPPAERSRLSIGEYSTRSPTALQAYLVAQHHTRRGERRVAVDSVKAALRHDPHFGLAHYLLYRLEGAQNTITGLTQAAILRAALEHKERFPERVRLLLEDAASSLLGDRVRALAQAEALAVRFPADGDVAYRLADTYFHAGLNMGEPYDRVIAAFRRALAFDDQDPELTQHFEVLMKEQGDSAAARAAWERCHTVAPTVCASDVQFRAIFRREDPLVLASGADSLAWDGPDNSMLRATPWDPAFGLAVTDSFAQIQSRPSRTRQRRASAYSRRSTVALARGQYDAAGAYLDTAASFGVPGPVPGLLQMLHHIVTGAHGPEAQAVRISDPGFIQRSTRAWWAAARQPTDSVEPLLRELEAQPWPDSARGVAIATGLRGIVALRLGDTSRALDLLKRVRSFHKGGIAGVIFMPGAALALALAQLEAAHGNPATARLYLADLYPLNDYTPFIGDVEELRARVTLALGDTAAAKTHLKNVIAVWGKADPPLQPRVAAARTLLARLEGR